VALGVGVNGGLRGARDGYGLVRKWAGRGEGGGEVDEVLKSVVPAWSMGIATNSTLPHCFLRTATRGSIFQSSHCVVCCILGPGKIQLLVE